MNEREIRHRLREWDPSADAAAPADELRARIRARLAAGGEPVRWWRRGWLDSRWVAAAAMAAGAFLVVLALARLDGRRAAELASVPIEVEAAAAPSPPTQVVYTATNGVRIYWSVPPAAPPRL